MNKIIPRITITNKTTFLISEFVSFIERSLKNSSLQINHETIFDWISVWLIAISEHTALHAYKYVWKLYLASCRTSINL